MTIKELKQFVGNVVREEINTPIMGIGVTGCGKSWSMKELAVELKDKLKEDVGYIDLRLATQELTDLIGIPRTAYMNKKTDEVITAETYGLLNESERDSYEPKTFWTKPVWFPKEGTKGILALEEVNRAPEDVRQAIFQLLTEWKLHTHTLPKGWAIVALINPDNGSYHVNQLDPAFKRRFVQLVVTPPDATDWCIWAKKNGIDDAVIRFVAQFPRLLGKDESITIDAFPTRAGYHMLATLLAKKVVPPNCLHEVATGIIGIEPATTFVQALKGGFEQPITAEQVFKSYDKVRDRHKKLVKTKRNDLLYVTMVDVIATCETRKLAKDEVSGLHDYLVNCGSETLTTIILRLDDSTLGKLAEFEDLVGKILEIKKNISDV
jgi:hypothetical protein